MNNKLKEQAARLEGEYGISGLAKGIVSAFSSMKTFDRLGFEELEDGSYSAPCRVNFYASIGGIYEINVIVPNGEVLSFEVPSGVIAAALENAKPGRQRG
ncbi:MAG TPA: hypothetical protein VH684_25510 [Xanthobacteraceae bacterium]|jgi:hypothetical protein